MARRWWRAGLAALLVWGCGEQGVPEVRQDPPPPQEFQWVRRVSGEQPHAALSVALAPEGTTLLLSRFDLPRASEDARQFSSLALHAWTPEGALRWTQRAQGHAPEEYDWEYQVRAAASGFLILDNPARHSQGVGMRATGVDLGCGPLFQNRLVRLDSEGRCLHQVGLHGLVRGFTVDGAGHAYIAGDAADHVGDWSSPYQHFEGSGQLVARREAEAHSFALTWSERGGLMEVRLPLGRGGYELHWLSPGFESLRSRRLPAGAPSPHAISPEGRLVFVVQRTGEAVRWGQHEFRTGTHPVVLLLNADGAPGAAFEVQAAASSLLRIEGVAADEHGIVIAGVSASMDSPEVRRHGLELYAYGWDGVLRQRQTLAVAKVPVCDSETYWKDSACRAYLAVRSLAVHPVHGIRIAGTLQGPVDLGPAGEAVAPGVTQSFVMALRR
jgi:hypothetical protein